jgi:integrase
MAVHQLKNDMIRRHVPIHDGFAAELKTWWKQDRKTGPIIHYNKKPVKRIQTTWQNTLTRAKIKRRLRPTTSATISSPPPSRRG